MNVIHRSLFSSGTLASARYASSAQPFVGLGCKLRLVSTLFAPTCAPSRSTIAHTMAHPLSLAGTCRLTIDNSRTRISSILQFVSNKVRNATHRSRVSRTPPGSRQSLQRGPGRPQGGGGWQNFRERLDALPTGVILWGVLGINGAVFAAWQYTYLKARSTGDMSALVWMHQNFSTGLANLSNGRIWTLLTATFSHQKLDHFLVNAFSYYFMAPTVIQILGNARFLGLYLRGGIICSAASVLWHTYIKRNPNQSSVGASGAIYSVLAFFACVMPKASIYIFSIVPMPAWAFVTGIFLWDTSSAILDKRVGTDTAGHVGGLLAGILYFLRLRA